MRHRHTVALEAFYRSETDTDFLTQCLHSHCDYRQYHKEKLRISRQMHQVGVAVIMIKKSVSYSEETFVRLLSGAMTGAFLSPKRLTRMEAVSRPGSGGTSGSNIDTPLDVNISSQVHARIPLLSRKDDCSLGCCFLMSPSYYALQKETMIMMTSLLTSASVFIYIYTNHYPYNSHWLTDAGPYPLSSGSGRYLQIHQSFAFN